MTTAILRTPYIDTVPTAGGKPAQMRISPAGDLWVVNFGAGGSPNKPYGIEAYSLANPRAPSRISFTGAPTFPWFNVESIVFSGTTMFAVANSNNSLNAVNVAVPAAPAVIGAGLALGSNTFDLAISPSTPHVIVPQSAAPGLRVVDVTVPAAMVIVSTTAGSYLGADTSLWPLVVVTEIATGQLRVYDMTIPAAPVLVGSLALSTNIRRLVVDPTTHVAYVATTAATAGAPLGGGQVIYVVNLAVPAAPALLATIPCAVAGDDTPLRLATFAGRRILSVPMNSQSFNPGRLQTFDVTTPAAPTFLHAVDVGQVVYDAILGAQFTYVANRGGAQELLVLDTRFLATP